MTDVARLVIHFEGDTSDLDKAYARAKQAQSDFLRDANRQKDVKLGVDSSGLDKGLSSASKSLSSFNKDSKVSAEQSGTLGKALSRLGGDSNTASSGMKQLASSIRSFSTVTAAVAGIPAIVAAVGALPAVATAATGATAQLSLGLGQGLAGAAAIGGTAVYGAVGALKAYSAILSRTVEDSRTAYEATHEQAVAQLEHQRNTILNTKASVAFNEQLNRSAIALTRVEAEIGKRVFPMFTKEIQQWGPILQRNKGALLDTSQAVAATAVSFAKWFRTAHDGDVLNRTIDFINGSATRGAQALSNLGATGILAFQHVIGPATKLQKQILLLTRSMFNWTNSAKGASTISNIVQTLQHRMYQLLTIVKNVGSGLIGVFTALNNQGGPDKLMKGLVNLSGGFRHLMERGNGARAAIVGFMDHADPLLNQMWRLVKTVVIQFGLLANNVIKAGQAGGKMGTLAKVVASLRKSVAPLRKMFQETFIALGPIIAKLIPEVAKFASVFLGSSGPLKVFLSGTTRLLQLFNKLPDGVKNTVASLVALKVIMGGLGVGTLVGGIGKLGAQFWAMNRASRASAIALGEYTAAQEGTTVATAGSTGVVGRAGGAFSKLGGAIKAGGVALLSFGTIATGGTLAAIAALAAAAYLVYRNWDRITKAVEPATRALGIVWHNIQPLVAALGGALFKALKSAASGFLSVIVPGKRLGEQTKSLSTTFGNFALKIIPPATQALKGLTNFIESHQGAFRTLGKIVGTVLTAGFRIWIAVIRTTVKIVGGLIRIVGRIIDAFRSAAKGVSSSGKDISSTVKGFTSNVAKTIKRWGSDFINFWRKRVWQPAADFLSARAKGMIQTLVNWRNKAVSWVRSLIGAILNFWKNRIWDPIAQFLINRADGMMQTLSNWKDRAVKWVQSLVGAVGDFWRNRVWDPIAKFLVNRADGMMNTLSNWKDRAVNWVKSLPGTIGDLWKRFWQGMADWVVSKKDGILNTMGNLVSGVEKAWKAMAEFTNKILTTLGLKEGDTKPIPSPSGPTKGTINAPGGGLNRPGAARGGLTSGTYADAYRQFSLHQMARGGMQGARGGTTKEPRLVYGEAGPEAYVTLGRYTKESAEALTKANQIWSKKGWLDKARREYTNRRAPRGDSRMPGSRWGEGYSVSPVTHYDWVPSVASKVHAIANATGTKPNTYPGHGEPGGSSEKYTADFWGAGGRGSPIPKAMGYKTADLAINKYNSNPGVLYVIRQGEYWRGGHWSSNTYGDPHYDHTHVSWDSPGGAKATGTPSRPNPKQAKFEKMWHETIDPWGRKWVARMSPASQFHRGSGAGTSKGVHSIYDWIDAKIPDMIGGSGSSLPSGSSPKGLTIGEALSQGGWPDSQLVKASSTVWHESRGNAHAQNPSGARGLMQIMPQTAKGVGANYSKLYDPIYNTSTGKKVYDQAGGWGPWVGANMGGDYRNRKVYGYSLGGIVPGKKGQPVLVKAHGGERVLPERLVKSFDRLARAVDNWAERMQKVGRHHRGDVDLPAGGAGRSSATGGGHRPRLARINLPGGGHIAIDRDPLNIRRIAKNWDEHVEHAVHHMRKEVVKELREQKHRMIDADDLLQAALRVQDSPAGVAGHARRTKRMITREHKRLGSRKKRGKRK